MQQLSWILLSSFTNLQKVSGCSSKKDAALSCCCWASSVARAFPKSREGLRCCVCGAACSLHVAMPPVPKHSLSLWASRDAGAHAAGLWQLCPFIFPSSVSLPPHDQQRVGGMLGLDAGSGVLRRTPQQYQKAGNLHFNNSLIMYLSDLVNILHFLNFADCRCCGLSSR